MTLIASSRARGMSSDRKAAAGVNENWRASRWEVFAGALTGISLAQRSLPVTEKTTGGF
jgi:hypothetical protein